MIHVESAPETTANPPVAFATLIFESATVEVEVAARTTASVGWLRLELPTAYT